MAEKPIKKSERAQKGDGETSRDRPSKAKPQGHSQEQESRGKGAGGRGKDHGDRGKDHGDRAKKGGIPPALMRGPKPSSKKPEPEPEPISADLAAGETGADEPVAPETETEGSTPETPDAARPEDD